ncbi:4Fe-4S ferredoxin [Campylobacter pinnipediorum]|uniref:4Fe-4S ferredoxin n=1 Tax=Campylobacter pinnipediorum TaxID=1965231 RepID=UPI000995BBFD|nr:4Fe-4S ferredoxin [Campylobacter pinnipediorum]AQW82358.1 ferredoxin-type protein [Campylobacter pinnipediorum subsp. pinnipediorum]
MQRRELFGKFLGADKNAPKFITPPYFSGEFDCKDCLAPCVDSCNRELLSLKEDRIVFEVKELGCNFCKDCALACEQNQTSVLNINNPSKIIAKTSIDTSTCLAWNGVICYNCQDVCRFNAINFFGVFRPMINDKCVNCGECFYVCFKSSISMRAV